MLRNISFAMAAVMGLSSVSVAQDAQPQSLDELLNKVEAVSKGESARHKEREQAFLADKSQQQARKRAQERRRIELERTSENLEAQRRRNDERIGQLQQQQKDRLGVLQELFGVLQQGASDAKGTISTSFVSLDNKDRLVGIDVLVQKAASGEDLPSIEEINVLKEQLLKEMIGSSEVVNFTANVIQLDGTAEPTTVTRIGDFGLVANGGFVNVNDEGELTDLPRQPAAYLTDPAASFQNGSGVMAIGIDPTRGQLLSLEVEKATIEERVEQGGTVGYLILFLGLIGVAMAVFQWLYLIGVRSGVKSQMKNNIPSPKNPLGRILSVYDNNKSVDVETLELKLDEAILKETPAIERFLTLIKLISAVAPLFGLLGTVIGMIETFQSITLFGTGDPKIMAGGISTALMTTVLGLVVAIPTLLLHAFVADTSKALVHILEEQSAGIIAVHAEQENAKNG